MPNTARCSACCGRWVAPPCENCAHLPRPCAYYLAPAPSSCFRLSLDEPVCCRGVSFGLCRALAVADPGLDGRWLLFPLRIQSPSLVLVDHAGYCFPCDTTTQAAAVAQRAILYVERLPGDTRRAGRLRCFSLINDGSGVDGCKGFTWGTCAFHSSIAFLVPLRAAVLLLTLPLFFACCVRRVV